MKFTDLRFTKYFKEKEITAMRDRGLDKQILEYFSYSIKARIKLKNHIIVSVLQGEYFYGRAYNNTYELGIIYPTPKNIDVHGYLKPYQIVRFANYMQTVSIKKNKVFESKYFQPFQKTSFRVENENST